MIRNYRLGLLTFVLFLMVSPGFSEDPAAYKADFIIKLLTYVEWPVGSSASSGVVVGVIGSPDMAGKLQAASSGAGQSVEIRQVGLDEPLQGVHIVYMGTQDKAELARILKQAEPQKILTISDAPNFAKFGVMINFYREAVDGQEKTKFEANKMALSAAGLKISSQLLKLAKLI